jgi:hypothetical protein
MSAVVRYNPASLTAAKYDEAVQRVNNELGISETDRPRRVVQARERGLKVAQARYQSSATYVSLRVYPPGRSNCDRPRDLQGLRLRNLGME